MNTYFLYTVVFGTVSMVGLHSAVAQTVSESGGNFDEIVVTSQKRDQDIKDVPLAVSVFSQSDMDVRGVQQFDDLADFVPGLEVQEQSANNPGFVIRGITSDSGEATIEPRVSIYQDGVSISRSRGSFVELFDSSVEVVRGPQPTLFGRSALIGAINVTSNRPDYETFNGQVRVGMGNLDYKLADGFVNIPLGEDAAIRFSGRYKTRDGYVENALGGVDFNGYKTYAGRISLGLQPTPDLDINLIAHYQRDDNPGTSFKSGTFLPTPNGTIAPAEAAALNVFGVVSQGRNLGLERHVLSLTGLIDYQLSPIFTLSSVTNFREFDASEIFDPDGFSYELFAFAENAKSQQFSQELRVGFETPTGISGFVGGSYFEEDGFQNVILGYNEIVAQAFLGGFLYTAPLGTVQNPLPLAALPTVNVNPTSPLLGAPLGLFSEAFTNFGKTASYDVFADATYEFTPQFSVTGGLRYTSDDKTSGYSASAPVPSQLTGVGLLLGTAIRSNGKLAQRSDGFDGLTWRLAANYEVSNRVSVFANYAQARRPDVISYVVDPNDLSVFATGQLPDNFQTLPSERVKAAELGFKTRSFDGRVFAEASIYRYGYKNFQTSIVDNASQILPINAGNASAIGVESSVFADLTDHLNVFAVYAYTDATFDDRDDEGNPQLFSGNRFRLTPKHAFSVGGNVQFNGALGRLNFAPIYAWKSSVVFADDNDLNDALQDERQGAYGLLDMRLTYTPPRGHVDVELFIENALDKNYLLDAGNVGDGLGIPTFIAGPPALYGVTLRTQF